MADPDVSFEAVIVPHRSLGGHGFRWIAAFLAGLSLLVVVGFVLAGAWPVMGFSGVEIGLALWLIRRHAFGPSGSEMLILTGQGLRVIQTDRRGRRHERSLPASWLRLDLIDRPGRVPALYATGGRMRVEIATALGEDEKRALAVSLGAALHRLQNPVFDNPQLRED